MTARPNLRALPAIPDERTRVCGIVFRRNDEHEWRCIQAIRAREHPAWSISFVSFRVTGRAKLRKVI